MFQSSNESLFGHNWLPVSRVNQALQVQGALDWLPVSRVNQAHRVQGALDWLPAPAIEPDSQRANIPPWPGSREM
jgi:hypothetical protein